MTRVVIELPVSRQSIDFHVLLEVWRHDTGVGGSIIAAEKESESYPVRDLCKRFPLGGEPEDRVVSWEELPLYIGWPVLSSRFHELLGDGPDEED